MINIAMLRHHLVGHPLAGLCHAAAEMVDGLFPDLAALYRTMGNACHDLTLPPSLRRSNPEE